MRSTRMSRSAWFAAACLMAAGSLTVAAPARADTFTPQAGPPSTGPLNYPAVLQPATPRSTDTYAVMTTVGSSAGVSNLDRVTMCWYKGTASSTCAAAATDPKTQFQMTWTQATNTFAVTGTNHYLNAASTSGYGTGAELTMDMVFTFQVSDAMLAGLDWNFTVTTVDDQGQSSQSMSGAVTVNYFGAVSTPRDPQSYGNMGYLEYSRAENKPDGSFLANGSSEIMMQATGFSRGSDTIPLSPVGFPAYQPDEGTVSLDCNKGAALLVASELRTRLGSNPQMIETGAFSAGTGETPDASKVHSCQLWHKGVAVHLNQEYSNTVTVGIGPTP